MVAGGGCGSGCRGYGGGLEGNKAATHGYATFRGGSSSSDGCGGWSFDNVQKSVGGCGGCGGCGGASAVYFGRKSREFW